MLDKYDGKNSVAVSQKTKGVMGVSPLAKLSYFDIATMPIPDMMHITAGVVGGHFFKMIMSNKMPAQMKRLVTTTAAAKKKEDDRANNWIEEQTPAYNKARAKRAQAVERIKAGPGDHAKQLLQLGPEPVMPVWTPSPAVTARIAKLVSHAAVLLGHQAWRCTWVCGGAARIASADCRCVCVNSTLQEKLMTDLKADIDRWEVSPACLLELEKCCWMKIQAPPGIVPSTKRPFSMPSGLNVAQWIGISKVTAKYLFSQVFSDTPLQVICSLFDYISACLEPEQSRQTLHKLEALRKKLAGYIHRFFPKSELSMVLHMLVFHEPSFLKMWGPARGCWVFAFERSVPLPGLPTI